jgi:Fe-S-cluster containining protein
MSLNKELEQKLDRSKIDQPQLKKMVPKLKKKNPRQLDELFHGLHQQTFKKMDCLTCANCCKTTSPIFREVDIKRISKKLRMHVNQFIDAYLKVDEEKDYVLKTSPCAFLDSENYCTIYEDRPLACREYPHTDRKNMFQILDLTVRNTLVCPAVSDIMDRIKSKVISG